MSRRRIDNLPPGEPILEIERYDWERLFRAAPNLTTKAKVVGFALSTYAKRNGDGIRPSQATIAGNCCITRNTAGEGFRELHENGWLTETKSATGKSPAEYRLSVPAWRGNPPAFD